MNSLSIEDLKKQRRWIMWRLIPVNGRETKVPYHPDGYKASVKDSTRVANLCRSGCSPFPGFSGVGLVLGSIDGVSIFGVDIDKCCEADTGRFSPETREVVIELDTYSEILAVRNRMPHRRPRGSGRPLGKQIPPSRL